METKGKIQRIQRFKTRDPLSPFLFTLVVDVLGKLIDKARDCNELRAFTVGRDKMKVTYLQFADDTLC